MTIAIIYDFDGTLSPGNMQEYDFIPATGKKPEQFWAECEQLAYEQDADTILTYMYNMLRNAQIHNLSIRKEAFREYGSKVQLFDGVKEWFGIVNNYAKRKGITIEHYINSSGIKEMVEGTSIAKEFKKIYACSFLYNVDGVAYWPGVVINYTTKTQFLFKINKGIDSVTDNYLINEYLPESERPIPFRQMIYFGDGTTDIPCMKLVKQLGGHSVAVYNPNAADSDVQLKKIEKLKYEDRVDYVMPADYRSSSVTMELVKKIIDKIHNDNELKYIGTTKE